MIAISNDNVFTLARQGDPRSDAYGLAALLLVESILHGLIERSIFTVAQAIDLVDSAAEVKCEIADERGEALPTLIKSLSLLASISTSLQKSTLR